MAVTVKNAVFWDVTLCGSYQCRRFGETSRILHQGEMNQQTDSEVLLSVLHFLIIANTLPSSLIPFTMMTEETRSS
jgi:hypothetical protein